MNKTQALFVGAAFVICVLVFIAPRSPKTGKEENLSGMPIALDSVVSALNSQLNPGDKKVLDDLISVRTKDSSTLAANAEKIREFWSERRDPLGMAVYLKSLAENSGTSFIWNLAGKDFYRFSQLNKESGKRIGYPWAIYCFEMALKINPADRENKLDLAGMYVEGSQDPMKGIGLIREVLAEDSTYVRALVQLGFFSLQSGQYEKAIERFGQAIKADTSFADGYVYLGQTYYMMGNREKAIENFENYYSRVSDSIVRLEVRKQIDQLKKN